MPDQIEVVVICLLSVTQTPDRIDINLICVYNLS